MKRIIMRVVLSAVLTAATLKGIYAMNSDVLLFPGYLVAWLFYPGGVHDGHGRAWLLVGTSSNVLFYALLWFGVLSLVHFPRNRAKRA
jgi:hypothetical protein